MHDLRPVPAPPTRIVLGHIRSIQALRAMAALFVVAFHSTVLWHDKFSSQAVPWQNGNAGVDIFFVISGFIMVVSSRRLLPQADGWRQFTRLRLIRIVPLYWLATVLKLVVVLVLPAVALHTRPALWNSIASFLFIPARDGSGAIRPVLDAGWTLSFEMLFYGVFACAMLFRLAPLRLVMPVMAVLALLSLVTPASGPAFASLASPLVLEFVLGALVAQLFISGRLERLVSPWMILPAAFGLAIIAFVPVDGVWQRVAIWGGGGTITLLCCVLAERWLDPLLPRAFERVGEASYSLYLSHAFVLPVVGILVAKAHMTGIRQEAALVWLCMLASIGVALLVYRFVEEPVTKWLRVDTGGSKSSFLNARTKKFLRL